MLAAYTELLALRRRHPVVRAADAVQHVERVGSAIAVDRHVDEARMVLVVNLGRDPVELARAGRWDVAFSTADERWGGTGPGVEPLADHIRVDGLTAALLLPFCP